MPSTFSQELEWLTCKTLLAQRLGFDLVLDFAAFLIDLNRNVFLAFFFVQLNLDVGVCSFAAFDAEVRLPIFVSGIKRLVFAI